MGRFIFGLCIGCGVGLLWAHFPGLARIGEEAERIFINAGVECLFMFEGA